MVGPLLKHKPGQDLKEQGPEWHARNPIVQHFFQLFKMYPHPPTLQHTLKRHKDGAANQIGCLQQCWLCERQDLPFKILILWFTTGKTFFDIFMTFLIWQTISIVERTQQQQGKESSPAVKT